MGALMRSARNTIGLRESSSLAAARDVTGPFGRELLPGTRHAGLAYQPCSTTLVGALQPALRSDALLGGRKVLSINYAGDKEEFRLGRGHSYKDAVLLQLLQFAKRASVAGWEIHFVEHHGRASATRPHAHRCAPPARAWPVVVLAPATARLMSQWRTVRCACG